MHAALGSADSVLQSDTNSQTSATTHSLSLFSLSLFSLSLSLSLSLSFSATVPKPLSTATEGALSSTLYLSLSPILSDLHSISLSLRCS